METVDSVPDSAMPVGHGLEDSEHENYIAFPVTDVVEWYTVRESGEVVRERFVKDDPDYPDDVAMIMDEADEATSEVAL